MEARNLGVSGGPTLMDSNALFRGPTLMDSWTNTDGLKCTVLWGPTLMDSNAQGKGPLTVYTPLGASQA